MEPNSNKKIFIAVIVVILLALSGIFYQSSLKDNKIGKDDKSQVGQKEIHVVVESPKEGESLDGKMVIKGTAKGWFFEGSFPYKLLDSDGIVISQGPVQAKGDWMTPDPVSFEQTVEFFTDKTAGVLVLQKDNPSKEKANDEEARIPVVFVPGESMTVSAFFGNTVYNPNQIDCSKVYPLERKVKKDPKTATAALKELLKGISDEETKNGYINSLNSGIVLNKIAVSNGVAIVDFSPALGEGVAGSCRVGQIRAQIESTLKQFPTISSVVISIDGESEGILQP